MVKIKANKIVQKIHIIIPITSCSNHNFTRRPLVQYLYMDGSRACGHILTTSINYNPNGGNAKH